MSATNAGSTVGKLEEKRKIILTEKAMMNKIESVQKDRERKVDEIKRLIPSLKELMKDEKNVSLVKSQLGVVMQLFDEATALHESLMPLIPTDEQQKQRLWFSKVNKHTEGCIEDVEAWLKIINKRQSELLLETHVPGRQQQEISSVEKDAQENGREPQFHQNLQNDDQDEIAPCDSISNQGSLKYSTKSNVSSTASARLRAEAEVAALRARQKLLKEKQQIRKQKEQLQCEAEIAASMAKANVLRTFGSSVRSASSRKLDGMESYFEKRLNILAEPFVPGKDGGPALPVVGSSNPHFGGTRSKNSEGAKYLQQGPPVPTKPQSSAPEDAAQPVSNPKNANGPSFRNISSEHNMPSIME